MFSSEHLPPGYFGVFFSGPSDTSLLPSAGLRMGLQRPEPSWEQPLRGDPRASDNMQVATGVCAPPLILVFMGIPMLPNFEANVVCGFCFC